MIRRATAADAALLVGLGRRMAAESATPYPEVEYEPSRRWLEAADLNPTRMFAALAEPNHGFITGAVGPWAFSDRLRAACDLLYVVPEQRGSSIAVRLWRAFADWAKASGAEIVIAGTTTGVAADRTASLLAALGVPAVGTIHMGRL